MLNPLSIFANFHLTIQLYMHGIFPQDRWWNCWGFSWISDSGRFPPLKILDLPLLRPFKSPLTFLGLSLLRKVYTPPESNRHFQPTSISCADRSSACLLSILRYLSFLIFFPSLSGVPPLNSSWIQESRFFSIFRYIK